MALKCLIFVEGRLTVKQSLPATVKYQTSFAYCTGHANLCVLDLWCSHYCQISSWVGPELAPFPVSTPSFCSKVVKKKNNGKKKLGVEAGNEASLNYIPHVHSP